MYNILVYYKAKSKEDIQGFYEGVKAANVVEKSRKDAGNIQYDYFFSAEKGNEILLVERWVSKELQQAHTTQPFFAELADLKRKYNVTTSIDEL